jgi:uncharacterized iron-regulated membrane protein
LNRFIHRVLGLLASLLMLYLAATGTTMQVLDLKAILTHAPQTDPTIESIEEGMYGNDVFPVIQTPDFDAAALPKGLNIGQAVGTVLAVARRQASQGTAQPGPMAWVELRMANGIPIGQVMMGATLEAFNIQTGEAVSPVPSKGLHMAPSLRQRLKLLHRFWSRTDVPGVYLELLAGLVMWTLLISGLIMYFRLLRTRSRQGRPGPFWLSPGGLWRGLHRVISVLAAVFILLIAFSGTWLGFESVVHSLRSPMGRPPQGQGSGGSLNTADFVTPLRDNEVQEMTLVTLAAMQRLHPDTPVKVIRLRIYGQMKQGVVVTGGDKVTQLVFNAESGQPATLSDTSYPDSGFPFGTQMHEDIKHFHSGEMFGLSSRLMNLFAGLSLTFLSVSGVVVYFDMWWKRRRSGRRALVWR